jgi:hypothetical protein
MGRIPRATLRSWWLAALLSAGCTSYQKTSLTEIESHPDKFVNKNVRVHYAASGDSIVVTSRTARARGAQAMIGLPDSSVALRVGAIRYPVLYGKSLKGSTRAVVVDVTNSRNVEVHGINWPLTLMDVGVLALLVTAVLTADVDYGPVFTGAALPPMTHAPSPPHQSPGP